MSEHDEQGEAPAETAELESLNPAPDDPVETSERIIRQHTIWSICAGAVPLPLFDIAAVTAVQMDALKQLARVHGVDYSDATGKRFVTALAGGTLARLGASLVKAIPGVGSILGGLSMMALSGASTWAVCQVAVKHFQAHGTFIEFDLDSAKEAYNEALEKGKEVVRSFEGKEAEARETYRLLRELENLRNAGVLTPEEFAAKEADLLRRL